MNELELLIDLHIHSVRQGPGSNKDTLKALEFTHFPKGRELKVADLGCGSGGPTITLAQNLEGKIIAVDLFPQFLEELNKNSQSLGLSDKVITIENSIDNLPFQKHEFDLIWSEGAIYNIGFENGISKWKYFLKPGGYIAVSDLTWIANKRPQEIEQFWKEEYPETDTASNKVKILENHDFTLEGYFYLSPESWLEHYYKPLESQFETFLTRHNYLEQAKKIVSEHKFEIELYRKYRDYYSYGFYIARKN